MGDGKVTVKKSKRLSLRLNKFKSASVELPKSITFTEVNEKVLGFCYTSNDEKSKYNSLILHLLRLHIHIYLPKWLKPMKYPKYSITQDSECRRWRYQYAIRSYGIGYYFSEGSFYLLHGVQSVTGSFDDLERLKIWTILNR